MRESVRRDKQLQQTTLEEKLLKALASDSVRIEPRELQGRCSIVDLLQEKLASRSRKR